MKSLLLIAALAASLSTPVLALDALMPMPSQEAYDKALQSYSCVDYQKALRMFRSNADAGHGLSQYMVGIMTEQGQGTDPDVDAALGWYMKAAKQGLADGYYALGDLYSRGVAVAKDPVQAYAWFDLADKGGHKLAADMKNSIAKNLQPSQLDSAQTQVSDWLAKFGR